MSVVSEQSINVPAWIKAELFENVLKHDVANYQAIKRLRVSPGVAAGENYATIMLRIELDVLTKFNKLITKGYMLKLPHDSDLYRESLKRHNFFDVERAMYMKIVPELEQIYRDVGLKVRFGANCYELAAPDYCVLLQDLKPLGFKNANRLEGLDMKHTESVLKKLAQWHAASAVRVARKGAYAEKYTAGLFSEANKELLDLLNNNITESLLECLSTYKNNEKYVNDIKNMATKLTTELIKIGKPDPNEFKVLNHGDCWSNNIMFQYDETGKIDELYFVDYQMSQYGTVAQDLLYFLISSIKADIKLSKFDYFIKYYHDNLIEHLKLLNYPKALPTLKDIHIVLIKYGSWAYFSAIFIMAVVLLEPTVDASFNSFFDAGEAGVNFRLSLYKNEAFRKQMEDLLIWLQNRGALE